MDKEAIKREVKIRALAAKYKLEELKYKAVNTWQNNKAEIIVLAPIVYGGVKAVSRTAGRAIEAKSLKDHRDRHIYDHSTGQYYETRRKLTSNERLELERRLADGEKKGAILRSMGLLR